jgi:hypothetical protein
VPGKQVIAATVITVKNKSYLHFIRKEIFGNLTYNTVSTEMPINFFFSLALFSQTILDVEPENPNRDYYPIGYTTTTGDKSGEILTSYLSFTPRLYINIAPSMRFVLGVNIIKGLGDFINETDSFTSGLFFMPLAKIDIMF